MTIQKNYINYTWRTDKEQDSAFVDVVISLIVECSKQADYYVQNLKIQKVNLVIPDCYLDEKGDLYVPTSYIEIKEEVMPEDYILLKTKSEIAQEYAIYKKNK